MAKASLKTFYRGLEEGLEKLLQLPAPHFVLFVADDDPSTGKSWCPDCVRNGPVVKQVMADKGLSLLEVLVGERAEWKDPLHPLRHHEQIKLSGVPDLLRWTANGPGAALGEELEKAASPEEAEAIVAKFVLENP